MRSCNGLSEAHYFLLSDPMKRVKKAKVLDLGTGGVCMATDEELPVGGTVELRIPDPRKKGGEDLEDLAYYRLLAEVRWGKGRGRRGFVHGLQFLDISTAEIRNVKGIRRIMAGTADKNAEKGEDS